MPKFRKKPVVVEAVQWFKFGDHPEVVLFNSWDTPLSRECKECGKTYHEHGWVSTLEGGHIVCPGDYIITGVKGEHYPCKPDIFAATYEPVDSTAGPT